MHTPSIDPESKRVAKLIVRVFETGSITPGYSEAVVLHDGAGITYGDHQSTDHSGSFDAILRRYVELGGAAAAQVERLILPLAEANATVGLDPDNLPGWAIELLEVLARLGKDPLMRQAQDEVFERDYWVPASEICEQLELRHPLSWAVIYDSCIHSGPAGVARIRRRFPQLPPSRGGSEKAWVQAYVQARLTWLGSHPRPAVQKTVYRMQSFQALISSGNWALTTPFTLRRPAARIA